MVNAACRAWIVAASIGAVEALKDQGICRWNGVLRSLQQHAKNNMRSYSQAKKLSGSSSSAISNKMQRSQEEKVRKVMELNCWGPNTTRFQILDFEFVDGYNPSFHELHDLISLLFDPFRFIFFFFPLFVSKEGMFFSSSVFVLFDEAECKSYITWAKRNEIKCCLTKLIELKEKFAVLVFSYFCSVLHFLLISAS